MLEILMLCRRVVWEFDSLHLRVRIVHSPHISAHTNIEHDQSDAQPMNEETYHPGRADCTALRMYNPDQLNVYHPRRADVVLWMRTILTRQPDVYHPGRTDV